MFGGLNRQCSQKQKVCVLRSVSEAYPSTQDLSCYGDAHDGDEAGYDDNDYDGDASDD